jgi:RHS repeat-associated protein
MCPGTIVLAGGAGGSGDGSGDGEGGDGKDGANGGKGENDPNGDGKGGKCGSGGAAGCTGCSKKPAAGDPIDVGTGNVYIPQTSDLLLPGPFELDVQRSYSTKARDRDVGMGFGWSFTFGWSFEIKGSAVTIVDGAGKSTSFKLPPLGSFAEVDGWLLDHDRHGFVLANGTDYLHRFSPLPKHPNRYVLTKVIGLASNGLVLEYDDNGVLRCVTDSALRKIHFARDQAARVTCISVPDPTTGHSIDFARYTYDANGDLVSHTDADGNTTRYAYTPDHRIVARQYPSGLTYHYVYDGQLRCFESWGDYPGGASDPSLDPDLSPFLADGTTKARGLHHVKIGYLAQGGREVVNSNEVQRFFFDGDGNLTKAVSDGGVTTREYDAAGNVIAETDRNGATRRYDRDVMGRIVRETGPGGDTVTLIRDDFGRTERMVDAAGNTVSVSRDSRGFVEVIEDQRGGITAYKWDRRGLMREQVHPNGSRTTYAVDAHGNLAEMTLPTGAVWKWKYDFWGRNVERTDPLGRVTTYGWSLAGRLMWARERDGSTWVIHRDAMANPVEVVYPDGSSKKRSFAGVNWLYEEYAFNGDKTKASYDREGRIVALYNERGEKEVLEWKNNNLVRYVSFDGVEVRRGYDKMGRRIWETTRDGKVIATRDPDSRITSLEYPDGSVETFRYNALRELAEIESPTCVVSFERDALGGIIRETVTARGETTVVTSHRGRDGLRAGVATSLGHAQQIERDAFGYPARLTFDETNRVEFTRDPLGNVTALRLPAGGVIHTEYDALTRVVRRAVTPSVGAVGSNAYAGQPAWLGPHASQATIDKSFRYSPAGNLIEGATARDGIRRYAFDQRNRLVGVETASRTESFSYDSTSNLFVAGEPKREYGPGNRLLFRGDERFEYDDAGYLLARHVTGADGQSQTWTYEWNAQTNLAAVVLPDLTRVEFDYDPLSRRLFKRVLRGGADGSQRLHSTTRYVWDGRQLVHTTKVVVDEAGAELSRDERTYVYEDEGSYTPLAELVGNGAGTPYFFVTDVMGTPEEMVRADGSMGATVGRTGYGRFDVQGEVETSLGFPCQVRDEETGLAYNFHRYYDPDTGRFISPDPMGADGGFNIFAYCRSPVDQFDPNGLHGVKFGVFNPDPPSGDGSAVQPAGKGGAGNWSPLSSGLSGDPEGGTFKTAAAKDPALKQKFESQDEGHTEQKALHLLENDKNAKEAMDKGGTAKMSGEYPPCKKCHKAMEEYAKKKGLKGGIEYHYPVNQMMKYSGSGATAHGDKAKALQSKYDAPTKYNPKEVTDKNPVTPGSKTFKGEDGKTYEQAKSKAKTNEDGSKTPAADKFNEDGTPKAKKQSEASKEYQEQKSDAEAAQKKYDADKAAGLNPDPIVGWNG